jgi:hypothetical protein
METDAGDRVMSKGFESVAAAFRRVLKPKARYEKVCKCGHAKNMHEHHPPVSDLDIPSGTTCLYCDCEQYRFGSKRVAR